MPHQTSYFSKSSIDWDANPDVRALYKKIISIRKSSEPLAQGSRHHYADNDVATFTRVFGGEEVLVIVNTRSTGLAYTLPALLQGTDWTDLVNAGPVSLATPVNLGSYEFLILGRYPFLSVALHQGHVLRPGFGMHFGNTFSIEGLRVLTDIQAEALIIR